MNRNVFKVSSLNNKKTKRLILFNSFKNIECSMLYKKILYIAF